MLSSFSLFLRKLPPDLPKSQRAEGFHWCFHTGNIWISLMIVSTPIPVEKKEDVGKRICLLLVSWLPRLKTPSGSSRNEARKMSRLIIYCLCLCASQVRDALLLSKCSAFTLVLSSWCPFFSAFLPSIHLYIYSLTIYPSIHPSIKPSFHPFIQNRCFTMCQTLC